MLVFKRVADWHGPKGVHIAVDLDVNYELNKNIRVRITLPLGTVARQILYDNADPHIIARPYAEVFATFFGNPYDARTVHLRKYTDFLQGLDILEVEGPTKFDFSQPNWQEHFQEPKQLT